jgi:hypothetical protein
MYQGLTTTAEAVVSGIGPKVFGAAGPVDAAIAGDVIAAGFDRKRRRVLGVNNIVPFRGHRK